VILLAGSRTSTVVDRSGHPWTGDGLAGGSGHVVFPLLTPNLFFLTHHAVHHLVPVSESSK